MENFKEIAEKCLAGELSGRFVCRDGLHISSYTIRRTDNPLYPYKLYRVGQLNENGHTPNKYSHNDIIQFIPYQDMKPEKITIDIPKGKVPIMEQTKKGVVITWKEKELTYSDIESDYESDYDNIIEDIVYDGEGISNITNKFYTKVEVLRKLTNIRNYFGKPSKKNNDSGWVICINGTVYRAIVEQNPHVPVFAEKEHAEQAIKMLGDELKYLFEPW